MEGLVLVFGAVEVFVEDEVDWFGSEIKQWVEYCEVVPSQYFSMHSELIVDEVLQYFLHLLIGK